MAKKKRPLRKLATKRRRQGGKGKPFEIGNEWAWKPGQTGNAGGRPKMADTYRDWLMLQDPDTGLTNVQLVVSSVGAGAKAGDVTAAREIRQAVDGDTVHSEGETILVRIDQ